MDGARIGIYGGAFDPPHLGHLALARLARDRFGLAETLFVPTPEPPHKRQPAASFAERCAMVELALATEPDCAALRCSRLEQDLPRPSYTIHTVEAVMRANAGDCRFALIIGMDSLAALSEWYRAGDLMRGVDLIAVNRDQFDPEAVRACIGRLGQEYAPEEHGIWRNRAGRTLAVIADFDFPLSSTAIRAALARGESPPGLPGAVAEYIRQHRLYR